MNIPSVAKITICPRDIFVASLTLRFRIPTANRFGYSIFSDGPGESGARLKLDGKKAYDFVGIQGAREHAEEAFSQLENGYPPLIKTMRATGFREWRQHRNFLLQYVQMIRCRSPLFREQFLREWSQKRGARVLEVEGNRVKVDSLKLRHFSPGALKEGAINAMLTEMKNGIATLESFHWQLRLADSVDDGFVASDHPLMAWADESEGLDHRGTVLVFPLCWEACLIGRRDPLTVTFDHTDWRERNSIRQTYFRSAKKFVISPRSRHEWGTRHPAGR